MSLKISDSINHLIQSIQIYGNLFINSTTELRTNAETGLSYYVVNYTSLENLSVSASRHAYESSTGWTNELSPAIVAAFLRRTEATGEIMEITGYKIARVHYTEAAASGFIDYIVFSGDLDKAIRERMIERGILPLTVNPLEA